MSAFHRRSPRKWHKPSKPAELPDPAQLALFPTEPLPVLPASDLQRTILRYVSLLAGQYRFAPADTVDALAAAADILRQTPEAIPPYHLRAEVGP